MARLDPKIASGAMTSHHDLGKYYYSMLLRTNPLPGKYMERFEPGLIVFFKTE